MTSIDAQALAATLRRLEEQPAGQLLQATLEQLLVSCVHLFQVDAASLMMADQVGDLRWVLGTDPSSRHLEEAQLETNEGPCIEAFVHDRLVVTENVTVDPRWPMAGERLRRSNLGAVLGVPLHLSGFPVGSLDVVRNHSYRWEDAALDALARYGGVADAMLAAAVSAEQSGEMARQLTFALDYRAVIERGIGYLMARDSVTKTQAFERLRNSARSSRSKIVDVAENLLDSGTLVGEQR